MRFALATACIASMLLSCAATAPNETPAQPAPSTAASPEITPADPLPFLNVVEAPDRTPADRALDAGRHPRELLTFGIIPSGGKVAELGAGGGYTTELLARAVAPNGVVYAQNSKFILEKFANKPWSERLAKPVMKNVVRLDREFDDPFPPEVQGLDVVMIVLVYHDTYWMNVDHDKMNAAVYRALKPGGAYIVVDHSGRPGTGTTEVKTLHRIEEKVVREDVQKAGFKFAEEGTFLRNPSDTRDWNDSPGEAGARRGTSDRFVLKFVK